jgi:hypothetical protein
VALVAAVIGLAVVAHLVAVVAHLVALAAVSGAHIGAVVALVAAAITGRSSWWLTSWR